MRVMGQSPRGEASGKARAGTPSPAVRALRFTIMLTAASDAVEHNLLAADECGPPLDLGDLSGVGFRVHLGTERRSIATPCSRQALSGGGDSTATPPCAEADAPRDHPSPSEAGDLRSLREGKFYSGTASHTTKVDSGAGASRRKHITNGSGHEVSNSSRTR